MDQLIVTAFHALLLHLDILQVLIDVSPAVLSVHPARVLQLTAQDVKLH